MKKILLILSLFLIYQLQASDTTKVKKGFSFGLLPVIAYDTDVGFKYGALTNIYFFGDGHTYPKYLHSLYMEWSRTTKGSGINQIIYDSDYLIPKTRVTLEASYFTEKALDFLGFNGYSAIYDPNLKNSSSKDYLTRMYYKHERQQVKLKADFQMFIWEKKLRLLMGLAYYDTRVGTVDIENLNKGKKDIELLPDTATLYDKYVSLGIINDKEKNGGISPMGRLGLVYDTRDQEGNPMKGIWSEILLLYTPSIGKEGYSYIKLALTHRQYFTLRKKVLNLAYRISYQPKLWGEIPFYMLPFIYNSNINRDGLGGAKTLRGILRNRIVGDDYLYGNIETRWKFLRKVVLNQNLYLALNLFVDGGLVSREHKIEKDLLPEEAFEFISKEKENIHASYGLGLGVVINDNFILNINYGRAMSVRDGRSGFYVNMNYIF